VLSGSGCCAYICLQLAAVVLFNSCRCAVAIVESCRLLCGISCWFVLQSCRRALQLLMYPRCCPCTISCCYAIFAVAVSSLSYNTCSALYITVAMPYSVVTAAQTLLLPSYLLLMLLLLLGGGEVDLGRACCRRLRTNICRRYSQLTVVTLGLAGPGLAAYCWAGTCRQQADKIGVVIFCICSQDRWTWYARGCVATNRRHNYMYIYIYICKHIYVYIYIHI
jgi:hypothetical protein